MRLVKIIIENFRCIERIEINPKDFTSLIGPNNTGKSATLRAISLILNQEKPDIEEWRKGAEELPLKIEAHFDEILAWERAKPGIAPHVYQDKVLIKVEHTIDRTNPAKQTIKSSYQSFKAQEDIAGWADKYADLSPEVNEIAKTLEITNGKLFMKSENKEKIKDAIRTSHLHLLTTGAPEWSEDGTSIPVALQQALPKTQLIPAIRDAHDDGQPGAKTSFGLLLKSVILPAVSRSTEYQNLMDAVKALEKKLKGDGVEQIESIKEISAKITETISNLFPAKISLGMETPDAEKFIGANTTLLLDDGNASQISLQGHGLQRALVFALLELLATQQASDAESAGANSRSKIILFEEPELFMHPHMMRQLKGILKKISERTDWQVIIATHSPFLVDVATDPCSLVIFRRATAAMAPSITQLATDPLDADDRERLRATLDFHPTICEAFFAKHAVLVEGDTEVAVLNNQEKLFELCGIDMQIQRNTTIISCDGKWTIIPIAKILSQFQIPFKVIHDEDRKNETDAQLAAKPSHPFHANRRILDIAGTEKVFLVKDTFENILWTEEVPPKDKPYRAWKRIKELCAGHTSMDHCPKLREVVQFAYTV